MNLIQKALEKQEIYVAWRGDIPENSNKITKAYLNGTVDGYPRLVRADQDTGKEISLKQLKEDYRALLNEFKNADRNKKIKNKAKDIILSVYPLYKQNNMIVDYNLLKSKEKLLKVEENELKSIISAWNWINDIRKTANQAIDKNINISDIKWPENPK